MKKKIRINGCMMLLGAMIAFSGCSKKVTTQKLPDINMNTYKTYAWLPAGDTAMSSFSTDPTITASIRGKVNEEMMKKGYTLNAEHPDLLVLVHTKYDDRINFDAYPSSFAYYAGTGFYTGPWYDYYYPYYNNIGSIGARPNITSVKYTKGTVIIDLIDTQKREIVWRGKATESTYDPSEVKEEIVKNIDKIFEDFPS